MLYKMKYIVLHNTYKIYIFLNEVILQYNVIGFISVSTAQYRIEIIYTYYVPLCTFTFILWTRNNHLKKNELQ